MPIDSDPQMTKCGAGQFGRVLYAELACARGSFREHVAVKTMKCAYMHHFVIPRPQPSCL